MENATSVCGALEEGSAGFVEEGGIKKKSKGDEDIE